MDKNAIQKYAIWARNELIGQVKQRAFQYGISDKGYSEESASVINGRVLTPDEKRQRQDFVHEIQKNGFEQAVEEVAYTWFNRFVALRFMEVNDYLPTHVRVFSDASGSFNPEILKDVLHLDLEGLNKAKVSELLNANQTEELYRYLLLTQCNALNVALPEMFEKLGSYTEMLLPNNILKQDSVLAHLVNDIEENDFDVSKSGQVEIIGWMYQYYNAEPKDTLINARSKYKMPDVPFVTQLFTSDWIVRFMVDNTLGRLWLDNNLGASKLKSNWKYYLDEAEQMLEVVEQLHVLRSQSPIKSPEDIKLIDPCMGSGHILIYAFDVLMQIYESEGYKPRDAAKLILEKNLYGLDIDHRAYQLAYFALMMKARYYYRRIFIENIQPQVYHPAGFADGEAYGSLLKIDDPGEMPNPKDGQQTLLEDYEADLRVWNFKRLLAQKYDVVVTNPPYMNAGYMPDRLKAFILDNYSDYKSDLFAAYFQQVKWLCKINGHIGLLSPYVWMFINSYEKLRNFMITQSTITALVQLEYNAFESACIPVAAFTIRNQYVQGLTGEYIRLSAFKGADFQEPKTLEAIENPECEYRYTASSENYTKIPGSPVAYWISESICNTFTNNCIGSICAQKTRISTGNNDLFMRKWHEINADAMFTPNKWIPCPKGGEYRKWYGNVDIVLDYADNGFALKNYIGAMLGREEFFFKQGITWTVISSSQTSFRTVETGAICDHKGPLIYFPDATNIYYTLGLLNSVFSERVLEFLAPTIGFEWGAIAKIPLIISEQEFSNIDILVKQCINTSRTDWDSFETSWDFKRHPLI